MVELRIVLCGMCVGNRRAALNSHYQLYILCDTVGIVSWTFDYTTSLYIG